MKNALIAQIDQYLRGGSPIVVIETFEQQRASAMVNEICAKNKWKLLEWDCAREFGAASPSNFVSERFDAALALIEAGADDTIYLLHNVHACLTGTGAALQVQRVINLAQNLRSKKTRVVMTVETIEGVPAGVRDVARIVHLPLPTVRDLAEVAARVFGAKENLAWVQQAAGAGRGLTLAQAESVLAAAKLECGKELAKQAAAVVLREKTQVVDNVHGIEFVTSQESFENVAGLGELKRWIETHPLMPTKDGIAYGLTAPKGLLLVGVPGGGKSLSARCIASQWGVPLLRLDIGALHDKYVGETEHRLRQCLRAVEAMAPCVLWIDEIEKGLSSGEHDGGTSMRVLATILTWMQERTEPCFMVATANEISRLRPELLRRGRIDEMFFIDLPTVPERRAAFDVHIRKRGRTPDNFNLDQLAAQSDGYTGAEIEQAVIGAMHFAFHDGRREFTTRDILVALSEQVPLSHSRREQIEQLRAMAISHSFRSASSAPDAKPDKITRGK